jgi:hypothetical protein
MFLEILIAITTINILGCGKKRHQRIENDITWLYSADLGKLVQSYTAKKSDTGKIQYIYSPYLKDTKNGTNFYTITTHSGFGNYDKEPLMTVFSDKPKRETYKEILPEGLLKIFKNDSHRNKIINDDHPNGIINLNKKNGEFVSFPVTFTGCTPPSPNMLIKYLRWEVKKDPTNYDYLDDRATGILKGYLKNVRNKFNNTTIEDQVLDFGNKDQLEKKYGNYFMDHILRHCKITFKFMNKEDSPIFESLMNKNFNKFSNINVFIDSYEQCTGIPLVGCVTLKVGVMGLVLADAGEEEGLILAAQAGGKEVISEFVDKIPGLDGNTSFVTKTLISCGTDPTPLCLVNPIADYIMGCGCDLFSCLLPTQCSTGCCVGGKCKEKTRSRVTRIGPVCPGACAEPVWWGCAKCGYTEVCK